MLWVPWFWHVSQEWWYNPLYGYGWAVPVLAVFAWVRRAGCGVGWAGRGAGVVVVWVIGVALMVLLFGRVLSVSNPDWRLAGWVLACGALVGSFGLVFGAGGARWAGWMAFPLLFLLVATPWPWGVENALVVGMKRVVTVLAVELAGWIGVSARAEGSLIVTAGGVLGVNDACSGIRSFQASLMAALFLGEYYSLRVGRRIVLVGLAVGLAVVLNLIRSVWLIVVADGRGAGAVVTGHDQAGWMVFLILFGILFGVAWLLADRGAGARGLDGAGGVGWGDGPVPSAWHSAMASGGVVLVLAVAAIWFGVRGGASPGGGGGRVLAVEYPESAPGYAAGAPDDDVRRLLRYDWGKWAEWMGASGETWRVFDFRWDGGKASSFLAMAHGPEVCLPAAGLASAGDRGDVRVGGPDGPVVFRHLVFEGGGDRLHVFHAILMDGGRGGGVEAPADPWDRGHRLSLAWRGETQRPSRVLMVGLSNLPRGADARALFVEGMDGMLARSGQGGDSG